MPFNRLDHHILGDIRPRFKLVINKPEEECVQQLKNVSQADTTAKVKVILNQVHILIPPEERHYWTPELHITFDEHEAYEGTLLRCLIGPRQTVWAMFAFFYASIGIATLFLLMFGFSQWQMGEIPYLLYMGIAGLIFLPSLYTVALIGQRKGRDQMLHLVSYVYHHLCELDAVSRV